MKKTDNLIERNAYRFRKQICIIIKLVLNIILCLKQWQLESVF